MLAPYWAAAGQAGQQARASNSAAVLPIMALHRDWRAAVTLLARPPPEPTQYKPSEATNMATTK